MNYKVWDEADLSAYLDGQLRSDQQAALEADLERDPELQRQVEALRRTAALVQALPLREAPRNYLLTPSMVKAPEKQSARPLRWSNFLVMRLATALSAAAFVVAVGLQINPTRMFLTSAPAPLQDRGVVLQEEVAQSSEAPMMVAEAPVEATEEPAAKMVEESLPEALPEMGAPAPEGEVLPGVAPSWEEGSSGGEGIGGGGDGMPGEGWGVGGGPAGMGGGPAEEPQSDVAALTAYTVTLEAGICAADDTDCQNAEPLMTPVALGAPTALVEEREVEAEATALDTGAPEAATFAVPEEPPDTVEDHAGPNMAAVLRWLTIFLGLSTVGLGLVTWWLSRQR
ncbi:MAG: hypothetical protein RBT47_02245 [Anaerolineae bacterium]|jgi:hypothetical protein|nr:hypothetical protein [Anaerolineae bacterium]